MKSVKAFLKKETTFCVALLAAVASMFFVPPDEKYAGYIDFRTLALLFCLMTVVAGLQGARVFSVMGKRLCSMCRSTRALAVILVLLCFFSSMLITNDVALITFVPFALIVLTMVGREELSAWVIVLQTVAANLGSMLTPVGNPQNLYLHSHYSMSTAEFFSATAPVWILSLILLLALCVSFKRDKITLGDMEEEQVDKRSLVLYIVLFAVCLLVVARVMSWWYMLAITVTALLVLDRRMLLKPDFMLLATFICFFVFSGNLSRIDAVSSVLRRAMEGREMLMGAAASQFISNVPAALLLSEFTDNAKALLLGVDIGGLGTPIASLASLISLKIFASSSENGGGRFIKLFLPVNFALLAVLLIFAAIFQ